MKRLIFVTTFAMYIGPMLYGLIAKDHQWLEFGATWLALGWIPLVVFYTELTN